MFKHILWLCHSLIGEKILNESKSETAANTLKLKSSRYTNAPSGRFYLTTELELINIEWPLYWQLIQNPFNLCKLTIGKRRICICVLHANKSSVTNAVNLNVNDFLSSGKEHFETMTEVQSHHVLVGLFFFHSFSLVTNCPLLRVATHVADMPCRMFIICFASTALFSVLSVSLSLMD